MIITNSKTVLCNIINFNCGLSDCHNMIATSLKESCNPLKKVIFRSFKTFNEAELNDELSQVPFHVAKIFDDVDDIYQSPLILTELFQHDLINVSYLTACYLYQVMMTLHFLNDVTYDAESTQK